MGDNDTDNGSRPLFDILGKLDVTLGSFTEEARRRRSMAEQAKHAEVPRFIRIHGSAAPTAAGIGLIKFDNVGPDQGHFWYIRKLIVGGLTTTTVAAGRADVFITAMSIPANIDLASLGIQDWQDQLTALPGVLKPGAGEMVLRHNEELWIVLSAATPGQQYVAVGSVEDYQESASRQTWLM